MLLLIDVAIRCHDDAQEVIRTIARFTPSKDVTLADGAIVSDFFTFREGLFGQELNECWVDTQRRLKRHTMPGTRKHQKARPNDPLVDLSGHRWGSLAIVLTSNHQRRAADGAEALTQIRGCDGPDGR